MRLLGANVDWTQIHNILPGSISYALVSKGQRSRDDENDGKHFRGVHRAVCFFDPLLMSSKSYRSICYGLPIAGARSPGVNTEAPVCRGARYGITGSWEASVCFRYCGSAFASFR